MRAVGLLCDLMRLKFVHLSERKDVCDANALKFVILRVINALNLGLLAFAKALSAKSVVNLACGITSQSVLLERNGEWQGTLNLAQRNTAWRGEFDNETAWQNSMAQQQNSAQRIQCGKPLRAKQSWRHGKFSTGTMGRCLRLMLGAKIWRAVSRGRMW